MAYTLSITTYIRTITPHLRQATCLAERLYPTDDLALRVRDIAQYSLLRYTIIVSLILTITIRYDNIVWPNNNVC